jgi:hypothetical protein
MLRDDGDWSSPRTTQRSYRFKSCLRYKKLQVEGRFSEDREPALDRFPAREVFRSPGRHPGMKEPNVGTSCAATTPVPRQSNDIDGSRLSVSATRQRQPGGTAVGSWSSYFDLMSDGDSQEQAAIGCRKRRIAHIGLLLLTVFIVEGAVAVVPAIGRRCGPAESTCGQTM